MFLNLVLAIAATVMMDAPVTWEMPVPVADQWEDTHSIELGKDDWVVKVENTPPPPPPPAPVQRAAVAQAPAPSGTYTGMGSDVEQWRGLVAAYFPAESVNGALAVMRCESGGNPWADNPTSAATGLFQIMATLWGPAYGYTTAQLFDPAINTMIAADLHAKNGWRDWNASRHCWG